MNREGMVALEWRADFDVFVESGKASESFLAYLERDSSAQAAVELAFKAQAAAFDEAMKALRAGTLVSPSSPGGERKAELAATMATALREAIEVSPSERKEAFREATESVAESAGAVELKEAVDDLQNAVPA